MGKFHGPELLEEIPLKVPKVAEVSTGSFVGETSVILGQKASASVISRTEMMLCVLSRELFEYVYNSHESFALEIDKICAERE